MRDPAAKAKLTNLVDEAVQSKLKIQGEQQTIKELRDNAFETLGLKPALFNNYVACVFNNDYQTRKDNLEQQLVLVEVLMGLANE